jgi:hypothetical protein
MRRSLQPLLDHIASHGNPVEDKSERRKYCIYEVNVNINKILLSKKDQQ